MVLDMDQVGKNPKRRIIDPRRQIAALGRELRAGGDEETNNETPREGKVKGKKIHQG